MLFRSKWSPNHCEIVNLGQDKKKNFAPLKVTKPNLSSSELKIVDNYNNMFQIISPRVVLTAPCRISIISLSTRGDRLLSAGMNMLLLLSRCTEMKLKTSWKLILFLLWSLTFGNLI